MQCPKCQFENREGAIFCIECGTKLEINCSKCNHLNPPASKFCEECGKKYQVDPSNIKGKAASFKCHICEHVILVLKKQLMNTWKQKQLLLSRRQLIKL